MDKFTELYNYLKEEGLTDLSSEEFKVSKDELVESMYKTFSKKIKKNSLKLILELRE